MSIRKKIIYGYCLALGVALLGTSTGLFLGTIYQQEALKTRQKASEELTLLSKLQVDVLYNRPAKQLFPYLQQPQEFLREGKALIKRVNKIKSLLSNYNSSVNPNNLSDLQVLLKEYEVTVNKFSDKASNFLETVSPMTKSPQQQTQARNLLIQLVSSQEFVKFIEFPDKLALYYQMAQRKETKAENALKRAEYLRLKIIIVSLISSLLIAIILGFYTSRAIANPIQNLTKIAKRVSEESNFDLRVDVTSTDEVGSLATSFNQLIHQVKQLLEEKAQYIYELEKAKDIAEKANQTKSEFLAKMSHELRTPLNGILGYSQIISQSVLNKEQKEGINIIYQCGSHLLTLINDVLDIAKIETQRMQLYPSSFDLLSMLQGVVKICILKAKEKNIDLIYEPPQNLPKRVFLDQKRFRQVLLNLLVNAVKFTNQGSINFNINVEQNITENLVLLSFEIRDTGIGINEEQISRIFQPFEQAKTEKLYQEGVGLGLAISQEIVKMMGSEIQVKSKVGVGSSFFMKIKCPLSEWEYAENNQNILPKSTKITKSTPIIYPPSDQLQLLLNLAMRGRFMEIQNQLDSLQEKNSEYQLFVNKLSKWTRDFQMIEISQFLQDAINIKSS